MSGWSRSMPCSCASLSFLVREKEDQGEDEDEARQGSGWISARSAM